MHKRGGDANDDERHFKFRQFFYDVFHKCATQRRNLLRQWLWRLPMDTSKHTRVASVLADFLCAILFEPLRFRVCKTHFCLFGSGAGEDDHLAVKYAWLNERQVSFVVKEVIPHREALFSVVKTYHGDKFSLDGFIYDPKSSPEGVDDVFDLMWRRQLVLDFLWIVVCGGARRMKQDWIELECVAAIQMVLYERGHVDLFLISCLSHLHMAKSDIAHIPCWGMHEWDVHSEERKQRFNQPPV